jgi:hypothetical protein
MKTFIKHANTLLFAMCLALIASLMVNLFEMSELREELSIAQAQLETIELELPAGVTEPLTPETIQAIDMFCASWEEMTHETEAE